MALRTESNHSNANLAPTLAAQPALSDAEKQVRVRALVERDERFIKEIAVLRVLHQSYVALLSGHRELAAGSLTPKVDFRWFANSSMRVFSEYNLPHVLDLYTLAELAGRMRALRDSSTAREPPTTVTVTAPDAPTLPPSLHELEPSRAFRLTLVQLCSNDTPSHACMATAR
jgi:hypothetical protein